MALVVFLRGVNVGGHRTFRPSLLARQMKALDVVNVGAAGTFVVRAPTSQARLRDELRRRLPFETEIAIYRGREGLQPTGRVELKAGDVLALAGTHAAIDAAAAMLRGPDRRS